MLILSLIAILTVLIQNNAFYVQYYKIHEMLREKSWHQSVLKLLLWNKHSPYGNVPRSCNHTKITTSMKIRVKYRDLNYFCCPRNWRIAIQIQYLFGEKALFKVYTTFSCTCIWSAYLSHRMWRVFQFAPRPLAAKNLCIPDFLWNQYHVTYTFNTCIYSTKHASNSSILLKLQIWKKYDKILVKLTWCFFFFKYIYIHNATYIFLHLFQWFCMVWRVTTHNSYCFTPRQSNPGKIIKNKKKIINNNICQIFKSEHALYTIIKHPSYNLSLFFF